MKSFNSMLNMLKPHRYKKRKHKKPISKKVTVKHTKHFHKNKRRIPGIVKSTIGPREIIYGEYALKARFPNYLERPTQDVDVYSPTPKRDAVQAERKLDRSFGGDYFYVKRAQHPGTYKVVAYANQEGYADFTRKPKDIPYEVINGKRYVKLSVEKRNRMRSLRDPDYSWRHGKDRDALNRIKIYEQKRVNR